MFCILIIFLTITSSMFLLSNNPLPMIILLNISTLIICLLLTMMINTPWFSYIIMIIFLGAMLIIFIYMASLAPNEPMNTSYNLLIIFILPMLMLTLFFPNYIIPNNFTISPSSKMMFQLIPASLTITTAIFLFITMMCIVKITSIEYGPLKTN